MGTAPAPTSPARAAVKLRATHSTRAFEVAMTALLSIAAALLQLPVTPPRFPVARLEISPAAAAVEVGQQVRLTARALDAAGPPVGPTRCAASAAAAAAGGGLPRLRPCTPASGRAPHPRPP